MLLLERRSGERERLVARAGDRDDEAVLFAGGDAADRGSSHRQAVEREREVRAVAACLPTAYVDGDGASLERDGDRAPSARRSVSITRSLHSRSKPSSGELHVDRVAPSAGRETVAGVTSGRRSPFTQIAAPGGSLVMTSVPATAFAAIPAASAARRPRRASESDAAPATARPAPPTAATAERHPATPAHGVHLGERPRGSRGAEDAPAQEAIRLVHLVPRVGRRQRFPLRFDDVRQVFAVEEVLLLRRELVLEERLHELIQRDVAHGDALASGAKSSSASCCTSSARALEPLGRGPSSGARAMTMSSSSAGYPSRTCDGSG